MGLGIGMMVLVVSAVVVPSEDECEERLSMVFESEIVARRFSLTGAAAPPVPVTADEDPLLLLTVPEEDDRAARTADAEAIAADNDDDEACVDVEVVVDDDVVVAVVEVLESVFSIPSKISSRNESND